MSKILVASCHETMSDQTSDNARSHRISPTHVCKECMDMHFLNVHLPTSGLYRCGFQALLRTHAIVACRGTPCLRASCSRLVISRLSAQHIPPYQGERESFAHQHLPPFIFFTCPDHNTLRTLLHRFKSTLEH